MRRHLDSLLFAVLLLLGAAAIAYLSTRYSATFDWTAYARASLAPQSRVLLKSLKGPLEVTSYASPGRGLRPAIRSFIARYQRYKPDLVLHFVDPAEHPGAVRLAHISVDGELVIRYRGRQQRLSQLTEQSFTDALAALLRGGQRRVAFVTGDGERAPYGKADADLGTFMATLSAQGVTALPLNFSQVAGVPKNASLVVLASPLAQLSPGAVAALVQWVQEGGNLLWLTDPGHSSLGLNPLWQVLGLTRLRGEIIDPNGAAMQVRNPRILVTSRYPANPITHGFAMNTLFPGVVPLAHTSRNGWSIETLLQSSTRSYSSPVASGPPAAFNPNRGNLRGPLDFGYTLFRSRPHQPSQQRVVVMGDGDFLSNTFLGNGGNQALGQRIFNWLLHDDRLVRLPPRSAPDRHLALGQTGLNFEALLFLLLLPAFLIGFGSILAWRRRRR